jgi:pimeloyl-ACP methyl ester carboxylesterase
VVSLLHPQANFTRHYAVPPLLDAVHAVFAHNSRCLGNDSTAVHEQLLMDAAAGLLRLRELGFERIVLLGNSGGGSLYSYYLQQAALPPEQRVADTPAGPTPLGGAGGDLRKIEMPMADAVVFLAVHPGEGDFLLQVIDASVSDESDPASCLPSLDLYDAANGFCLPPGETRYTDEFVERYRAGQRARVERIDARARKILGVRTAALERLAEQPDDRDAWRAATADTLLTTYRTEADPRCVDLTLDPSARDYGSLFDHRPDLINYNPRGFARTTTPEAWLSTWSGLSSRASFTRCGSDVTIPALMINYTGDNAIFPSEAEAIFESLGIADKKFVELPGDHYGHPLAGSDAWGRDLALAEITDWLAGL